MPEQDKERLIYCLIIVVWIGVSASMVMKNIKEAKEEILIELKQK